MPALSKPTLTVAESNTMVSVTVAYEAVFTPFERFLAGKGLEFEEGIVLITTCLPQG
jgi:hypothetical protein